MGFIDAFVYAHHQHRRCIENPEDFGDCMEGRIRFMTAITPAYAHAYQVTCLTRHMPASPASELPLAEAPSQMSASSEHPYHKHVNEALTSKDGPSILTLVLALWMVKPLLDGVLSLDLAMEEWLSCLVRSSQPRIILLFQVSEPTPINTAELTALIEALSFLGPCGPVARDANSCIHYDSKHAAGVCLGTIQARTHVQLALVCQQSMLKVQHKLRLTMQHV